MPTREDVIKAIKQVYDPEIPVNIYDLGLIYEVDVQGDKVGIKMTLTSQGCPSAQQLPEMVRTRVSTISDVQDVDVQVVWEPQWNPSMISPEGKKILKLEDEE
jgi:FeS assembly SUF system protein